MTQTFDYKLHDNYLELRVRGSYEFDSAISELRTLLRAARDAKQQRVLVDYRELDDLGGSVEKVLYSLKAEEIYTSYLNKKGLPLRLAYLTRSIVHEPGAEIGRRIDGLVFEIFDNKDDAMSWLLFKV